ncbi:hypothetical protein M5689_025246 [Euphorbia peplus]|nr:hypothetical protein M5689_025246 [Euphorbia peplus]
MQHHQRYFLTNEGRPQGTRVLSSEEENWRIRFTVFESLLTMVGQLKSRSSWSFVSKLVKSKGGVEVDENEAKKIDVEFISLNSSKYINVSHIQNVLNGLEALESSL